jgi:amino acid transporter
LLDSTCLIVGIIVGVGIYQMTPEIARGVGGVGALLGLWIVGALLSLCGALSYAELAAAWPEHGGDYVYLNRAYGSWAGFLFGWAQLSVVRPGDIAVVAFAFGTYARHAFDPALTIGFIGTEQSYAVLAVIALTATNILGVREGKWTQNILTFIKAAGLLGLISAAFFLEPGEASTGAGSGSAPIPVTLALIFVLFTYGGWNEMAYVAAELREPQRNVFRALLAGMVLVTALYLLVNAAFIRGLSLDGLRASEAPAADLLQPVFPGAASAISALICISALGAVNGLIFTGARISFAVGRDYPWFGLLGRWSRRGTPAVALAVQGAIAVVLILALGSFINAVLYTAAVVYSFYAATTLAVIRLRHLHPARPRPFRVPGYPIVPIIFVTACLFLIWSAIQYRPWIALGACVLGLIGLPIWWSMRPERVRPR